MHYLDHNASSPLRPEAKAAMERAYSAGNPSSVHGAGRAARKLIEEAREQVAALNGVAPSNVIFTSGGTEANALALRGAVEGSLESDERITRLFVSAIEHDSVLKTAASLAERIPGLKLEIIPVSMDGVADLSATTMNEGKGRALVVMMAANNETGVDPAWSMGSTDWCLSMRFRSPAAMITRPTYHCLRTRSVVHRVLAR